jgi:hypothetical protein
VPRIQTLQAWRVMGDGDNLPASSQCHAIAKGRNRCIERRKRIPWFKLAQDVFAFSVYSPLLGEEGFADAPLTASMQAALRSLHSVVPKKRMLPISMCRLFNTLTPGR